MDQSRPGQGRARSGRTIEMSWSDFVHRRGQRRGGVVIAAQQALMDFLFIMAFYCRGLSKGTAGGRWRASFSIGSIRVFVITI